MKDVIITVVCVVIIGAAAFFATYFVVEHKQQAAIAEMPQPSSIDGVRSAEIGKVKAENERRATAIAQQQSIDAASLYRDSAIAGGAGVIVGIIVGVLLSNSLTTPKQPHTPQPA